MLHYIELQHFVELDDQPLRAGDPLAREGAAVEVRRQGGAVRPEGGDGPERGAGRHGLGEPAVVLNEDLAGLTGAVLPAQHIAGAR